MEDEREKAETFLKSLPDLSQKICRLWPPGVVSVSVELRKHLDELIDGANLIMDLPCSRKKAGEVVVNSGLIAMLCEKATPWLEDKQDVTDVICALRVCTRGTQILLKKDGDLHQLLRVLVNRLKESFLDHMAGTLQQGGDNTLTDSLGVLYGLADVQENGQHLRVLPNIHSVLKAYSTSKNVRMYYFAVVTMAWLETETRADMSSSPNHDMVQFLLGQLKALEREGFDQHDVKLSGVFQAVHILTWNRVNRELLVQVGVLPYLEKGLVQCVSENNCKERTTCANIVATLQNLACEERNEAEIMKHKQLLDSLVSIHFDQSHSHCPDCFKYAKYVLSNLVMNPQDMQNDGPRRTGLLDMSSETEDSGPKTPMSAPQRMDSTNTGLTSSLPNGSPSLSSGVQPGNMPHNGSTYSMQPGNMPHNGSTYSMQPGNMPHNGSTYSMQPGNMPHNGSTYSMQPGNMPHNGSTYSMQPGNMPHNGSTYSMQPGNMTGILTPCSMPPLMPPGIVNNSLNAVLHGGMPNNIPLGIVPSVNIQGNGLSTRLSDTVPTNNLAPKGMLTNMHPVHMTPSGMSNNTARNMPGNFPTGSMSYDLQTDIYGRMSYSDMQNNVQPSYVSLGNTTSNGNLSNTTSNRNLGNTTSNGNLGITTSNGNFGNTTSNGTFGNTTSNGNLGNTTSNGNLGNTTSNGNLGNTTSNGPPGSMVHNFPPEGLMGNLGITTSNGNLGNTTSNGNLGNTTSNGNLGNTTSNGPPGSMVHNFPPEGLMGNLGNTTSNGNLGNKTSSSDTWPTPNQSVMSGTDGCGTMTTHNTTSATNYPTTGGMAFLTYSNALLTPASTPNSQPASNVGTTDQERIDTDPSNRFTATTFLQMLGSTSPIPSLCQSQAASSTSNSRLPSKDRHDVRNFKPGESSGPSTSQRRRSSQSPIPSRCYAQAVNSTSNSRLPSSSRHDVRDLKPRESTGPSTSQKRCSSQGPSPSLCIAQAANSTSNSRLSSLDRHDARDFELRESTGPSTSKQRRSSKAPSSSLCHPQASNISSNQRLPSSDIDDMRDFELRESSGPSTSQQRPESRSSGNSSTDNSDNHTSSSTSSPRPSSADSTSVKDSSDDEPSRSSSPVPFPRQSRPRRRTPYRRTRSRRVPLTHRNKFKPLAESVTMHNPLNGEASKTSHPGSFQQRCNPQGRSFSPSATVSRGPSTAPCTKPSPAFSTTAPIFSLSASGFTVCLYPEGSQPRTSGSSHHCSDREQLLFSNESQPSEYEMPSYRHPTSNILYLPRSSGKQQGKRSPDPDENFNDFQPLSQQNPGLQSHVPEHRAFSSFRSPQDPGLSSMGQGSFSSGPRQRCKWASDVKTEAGGLQHPSKTSASLSRANEMTCKQYLQCPECGLHFPSQTYSQKGRGKRRNQSECPDCHQSRKSTPSVKKRKSHSVADRKHGNAPPSETCSLFGESKHSTYNPKATDMSAEYKPSIASGRFRNSDSSARPFSKAKTKHSKHSPSRNCGPAVSCHEIPSKSPDTKIQKTPLVKAENCPQTSKQFLKTEPDDSTTFQRQEFIASNTSWTENACTKQQKDTRFKRKCPHCSEDFVSAEEFLFHMKHKKHFKCRECVKCFAYKKTLAKHVKDKHDPQKERSYKCVICDREFGCERYMKEHEKVHGEFAHERYTCRNCHKGFPYRSVFNKHIKVCR